MNTLRSAWLILKKDITTELRSKEVVTTMLLFALLLIVIFFVAFSSDENVIIANNKNKEVSLVISRFVGPGILWVTLLFSGTIGINRVLDRERQNGCFAGICLSPAGPAALYLAKVVGLTLFMVVTQLVTVPLTFMFLGLELADGGLGTLILSLFLGTVGFAFMGTLFGAMFAQLRLREVLLPIVVYPLVTPVIVAGIELTGVAMGVRFADESGEWLRMMVGFDLLFAVLPTWLFGRVMME
jgi:heme exporter protein B